MSVTTTVYVVAITQGTQLTGSVPVPGNAAAVSGQLQLTAADRADPNFYIGLELHAYRPFGLAVGWCLLNRIEWQGGPAGQPPTISSLPAGMRVRLCMDLSRPASVGATITTN